MSPLSPAAEAVYEAIKAAHFEIDPYGLSPADLRELAAATLRALVDRIQGPEKAKSDWGRGYADGITDIRAAILATAAELDPSTSLTGET